MQENPGYSGRGSGGGFGYNVITKPGLTREEQIRVKALTLAITSFTPTSIQNAKEIIDWAKCYEEFITRKINEA